VIDLKEIPEDPLLAELEYFMHCLRSAEMPEIVTLNDACDGLAIAEAVLDSLEETEG
jgi:hypothetical protein